jgi:hypothetical protein
MAAAPGTKRLTSLLQTLKGTRKDAATSVDESLIEYVERCLDVKFKADEKDVNSLIKIASASTLLDAESQQLDAAELTWVVGR